MNKRTRKIKGPRLSWGVDVGQHGIRIVGIAGKDNNKTLQHVSVEDAEGDIYLARLLGRHWKTLKARGREACCNLGPISVIVLQVEFPEMDARSVIRAARTEAEQLIPDYQQMVLDIQLLGRAEADEDGKQSVRALIVAAPERAVRDRQRFLCEAGVDVESISPDGIAIANAVTSLCPPTDGGIIVVDIGANVSNLVAVSPPEKTIAPIVRFISGGVNNLAKADESSENAQSARERQASSKRWLREIDRSIQFVADRLGAPTNEILVVGDGADKAELLEWVSQAIQMPVKPWNPLKNISPGINIEVADIVEKQGHLCAIALGLALMNG